MFPENQVLVFCVVANEVYQYQKLNDFLNKDDPEDMNFNLNFLSKHFVQLAFT